MSAIHSPLHMAHGTRRQLLRGAGGGLMLALTGASVLSACGGGSESPPEAAAEAPRILVGPEPVTMQMGVTFTLTVQASGANLRYQWLCFGRPIEGATLASYSVSNAHPLNSGSYAVRVSNEGGCVLSDPVEVRIEWPIVFEPVARLRAGAPGLMGHVDGTEADARFNVANYLARAADGRIAIADMGNHVIRILAGNGSGVTTLAGMAGAAGHADGLGNAARFNEPGGLAFDSVGDLYVADWNNHVIRRVTPDGTVETIAGSPGEPGAADGAGAQARFHHPNGLAVDGNDDVYVCDFSTHRVRKIQWSTGVVTTVAGTAHAPGFVDGAGAEARFNLPAGLAVDADGRLFVADQGNHVIRRIDTDGSVSTYAGMATVAGHADGPAGHALFDRPAWLAFGPGGALYVVEGGGTMVRCISANGEVSTLAGAPGPTSALRLGSSPILHNTRGLVATGPDTLLIAADSALAELQLPQVIN
jgi:DNA-binding beta-propeller fold protein YncE